jgi:hypothetical protein
MPASHVVIPVSRAYSPQQMESIKLGFVPQVMEDKWFAFYEDPCLYLHRSWTSYCIFIVRFEELDGQFLAREIVANRDHEQYRSTGNSFDVELAFRVIVFVLLRRRTNARRSEKRSAE